jgi:membrane fusion protein, multidrug efflux system
VSTVPPDEMKPGELPGGTDGKARAGPGQPPGKRRRLAVIGGLLALAAAIYGVYWYVWSLSHEDTDDAQVEGHIHPVASHVSGYVSEVAIRDNQFVTSGTVLVRIQSDDYQARGDLAEAQLADAEAGLKAAERNVDVLRQTTAAGVVQARAGVQQAEAKVEAARSDAEGADARLTAATAARQQAQSQVQAAQADFDYASFNRRRLATLSEQNQAAADEVRLTEANYQSTEAKLAASKDAVAQSEAQVKAAQRVSESARASVLVAQGAVEEKKGKLQEQLAGPDEVRMAEAKAEVARAGVQAAKAQLDLARLELGYCTIIAPADGVISRRSVEVGQFLQPGQPFLAVVPLDNTWVVANFKETQLREMRPGQPALLEVDAYPNHPFRGVVDSLAAGTGARFSILPPENATGNFVKVVQRVPVKIVLLPGERDPQRPLRLGMNVVVIVNTGAPPPATGPAP